jgi:hypothetical protein
MPGRFIDVRIQRTSTLMCAGVRATSSLRTWRPHIHVPTLKRSKTMTAVFIIIAIAAVASASQARRMRR